MVRKTVTLVFCDVADSTPLGERLDPEALRGVWSSYHETARAVLERHGGTIEKFVGDAVLAVFGIPVVHEDDALRAVRAAVELRDALVGLNDDLERAYGIRISVRTGVHTGEVFAGDPAQGDPFATGDAVVVAQRLEASAAGGEILAGDATVRLVRDAVIAEQVPPLSLKGKSAPVTAWRVLDVEPGVAGLLRRMDSPLVGRTAELARLRGEFELAEAERACRVVTVLGEPGIGKSRLAAELVASLDEPALVLEGRCLPYGNGITYWPLVEIVGRLDLERELEGEPDGETVRGRLLEAVGRAEATSRSDELYWAVRRLLETLARERPVLLVLDDVQWAEPAFLDLIEYLAGWSRDAPILVCCLARTDLAELRPAWASTATIELAPLAGEDARRLLENLAGQLDAAAAEAVGRATGGNPLFLEEMLRMLVEDGVLVEHDGVLRSLGEVESMRVPETVQAVLAARLDRLDAEELAVLQSAAVIGPVFWWGAVADLAPPEQASTVAATLQALVRKGFIRPDRRTFAGEDGFRFGHILIRDAAYESMPKRLRSELHERFAIWVERTGRGAELDEIRGFHLEQAYVCRLELGPAGDAESALATQAAACLARAGRRALARTDAHAAVTLLERATSLLGDDAGGRLELLLDLSIALHRSGELMRSIATLDEILAASPSTQLEWSARLERTFVVLYTGEGSPEEVLEVAEQAAGVFAELGDDAGLAKTWNAVGLELFIRGLYAQMATAAEHALEHARRAGDERQEAATISALCVALALGPTPAEAAIARCQDLLARAEELGSAAMPTALLASLEAMRGNVAEAWTLYGAAKEALAESGSRIAMAGLPLYAEPLLSLDLERAETELRPALTMLAELGERGVLPTVAAHLAEVLVRRGALDEAEELTRLSERLTGPTDVATHVVWQRTRALALARRGGRGDLLAREAVQLARTTDSPHLLAASLVVLAEAARDPAATVEAARLWEEKGHLSALSTLDIEAQAR